MTEMRRPTYARLMRNSVLCSAAIVALVGCASCSRSSQDTGGSTAAADSGAGTGTKGATGAAASPPVEKAGIRPSGGQGVPEGAEKAIRGYYSVTKCTERLAWINNPEGNRAALEAHYNAADVKNDCVSKIDKVEGSRTENCDEAKVGAYCFLNVYKNGDPHRVEYELKRVTSDTFKIDWRSSVEYNPTTFIAFKAKMPAVSTIFRVWAKLDDYFNFEWRSAKGSHYSVALQDPQRNGRIHGYIPKAGDGERLFNVLQDGKEHAVMVAIKHRPNGESDMVDIVKLVSLDWRENAAEFAAPP